MMVKYVTYSTWYVQITNYFLIISTLLFDNNATKLFFFSFLSTISLLVNILESLHSWDPDSAVQTEDVLR